MRKNSHLIHIASLILLGVIFFSVLVVSHITLRGARLDLTQQKLWTLTEGSKTILRDIKNPITISFFLSQNLVQNFPSLRAYSQHVRGLLSELARHAQGKIKIEYIDPEAFSEEEDQALAFGLRSIAVINDQPLYFGLIAANIVDGIATIPVFATERQHQLEYDLIQIIRGLALAAKPVLGIVTSLPLDTGVGGLSAARKGQARPFLIYEQLRRDFTLKFLEQNFDRVPEKINLLMVAHPKKLSAPTLYALDQFVMRGGRMLALVDPYCEISQLTDRQGKKIRGLALSSNLEPLLTAWGVRFEPNDLIADRTLAQTVGVRDALRQSTVERKYVLWLAVNQNMLAKNDIITRSLSLISLGTSGSFTPIENHSAQFMPLITSSKDAMLLSSTYIKTPRTPDDLLAIFNPTNKNYVLAARISGDFKSAFARAPKTTMLRKRRQPAQVPLPPYIAQTKKPAQIILVADSDLLEKRFWIDVPTYIGQGITLPVADNATFIINALDALIGNDALIALRSRAPHNQSFILVDGLRAQASRKLADKEYELRKKIKTIEQQLTQFGANPSQTQNGQQALFNLRRELLAARRSLHDVRQALNHDIEMLGFWVKFFNIAFIPLILILIVLVSPWIRTKLAPKEGAHHG